jgi:hypothetical protein
MGAANDDLNDDREKESERERARERERESTDDSAWCRSVFSDRTPLKKGFRSPPLAHPLPTHSAR